jgi:hypothetical protein
MASIQLPGERFEAEGPFAPLPWAQGGGALAGGLPGS